MSDSHGDRDIIQTIKDQYQGKVDAIFHNGDSELLSNDPIWEGIKVVRGNCDYDNGYPESLVTQLGDAIIAQTHGHLYGINFTWERLDLWATCIGPVLGEMVRLFLSIQVRFCSLAGRSWRSSMPRLKLQIRPLRWTIIPVTTNSIQV